MCIRDRGQRDKLALRSRAQELLAMVGLPERALGQPVHEFSGGQRQRIAIARALSVKPELIVLDEPTSSLDVSIRAQILNILKTLQRELRISYVFIGHDLQTVRFMSTTLCVMYFGRIVEIGPAAEVFACPAHPYTGMLLRIARSRDAIVPAPVGEPPDPVTPPQGCAFRSRCQRATSVCETLEPPLRGVGGAHHYAACHNAGARVNSLAR